MILSKTFSYSKLFICPAKWIEFTAETLLQNIQYYTIIFLHSENGFIILVAQNADKFNIFIDNA